MPNRFISNSNFSRLVLARSYLADGKLDDARQEIAALRGHMDSIDPDEIAYTRQAAAQLESLRGELQLKGGEPEAAAGHFRRAIELLLPRQHADSPHLASARADLALALATTGDRVRSKALADQARAAFATHPAVAPHFRRSLIAVDKLLKRT